MKDTMWLVGARLHTRLIGRERTTFYDEVRSTATTLIQQEGLKRASLFIHCCSSHAVLRPTLCEQINRDVEIVHVTDNSGRRWVANKVSHVSLMITITIFGRIHLDITPFSSPEIFHECFVQKVSLSCQLHHDLFMGYEDGLGHGGYVIPLRDWST